MNGIWLYIKVIQKVRLLGFQNVRLQVRLGLSKVRLTKSYTIGYTKVKKNNT